MTIDHRIEREYVVCDCIACRYLRQTKTESQRLMEENKKLKQMLLEIAEIQLFLPDGVILARQFCKEIGIGIKEKHHG